MPRCPLPSPPSAPVQRPRLPAVRAPQAWGRGQMEGRGGRPASSRIGPLGWGRGRSLQRRVRAQRAGSYLRGQLAARPCASAPAQFNGHCPPAPLFGRRPLPAGPGGPGGRKRSEPRPPRPRVRGSGTSRGALGRGRAGREAGPAQPLLWSVCHPERAPGPCPPGEPGWASPLEPEGPSQPARCPRQGDGSISGAPPRDGHTGCPRTGPQDGVPTRIRLGRGAGAGRA